MEKIKYTTTLEDCRDYVKFQYKIPRIKKFKLKQFKPLLYMALVILLIIFIFMLANTIPLINAIAEQNSMTTFQVLKSEYFLSALSYAIGQFLFLSMPLVIMWYVIFLLALGFSKHDFFHVESNIVYSLLKGQDLDTEITPQDDGLLCVGKSTTTLYKWDKIIDVYDTGKSFLVFVGDYAALVIPFRAFETEEERKIFFNYLNEKLRNK